MDKRKQKTREAIRNAYAAILLERQTPKMTVTALAQKANIDRKTFYLHYDTIEDVMYDYNRQIIERLVEMLEEQGFFDRSFDVSLFFTSLNQIIGDNIAFFQYMALQSDLREIWDASVQELIHKIIEQYKDRVLVKPEVLDVYVRFIFAGSQAIYKEWLLGKLRLSLDELGRIVTDAAFEGFCPILK